MVKDIICPPSFLLHLLSVRETVESQREAGIHPLEQAWLQERTNPQTWRPGERAVTLPENRLHTAQNRCRPNRFIQCRGTHPFLQQQAALVL